MSNFRDLPKEFINETVHNEAKPDIYMF